MSTTTQVGLNNHGNSSECKESQEEKLFLFFLHFDVFFFLKHILYKTYVPLKVKIQNKKKAYIKRLITAFVC